MQADTVHSRQVDVARGACCPMPRRTFPDARNQNIVQEGRLRNAIRKLRSPEDKRSSICEDNWDRFVSRLKILVAERGAYMYLSLVPAIYGQRFGVKLKPQVLGYFKLSRLFRDPRLANICKLEAVNSHDYRIMPVGIAVRLQLATILHLNNP
jgi:hypothetical protein